MHRHPGYRGCYSHSAHLPLTARRGSFASLGFPRFARLPAIAIAFLLLITFAAPARAQIEPAAPGSVEYTLTSNGQSWIETSDPIVAGGYVEDLLTDRNNQPDGRGVIGIVTDTAFDPDYNQMAATVDFGRGYSSGIVFDELSAVQIVPEPSTLLLLPGLLLCHATTRRRRR